MMIVLFTDFGSNDPYVGQVHCAIRQQGWKGPIIDLLHNAPRFDIKASAYLLAALVDHLPEDCVVMAVVDPGVGSERAAIMVQVNGRWLVGPDNGLLSVATARAERWRCHRIDWKPDRLSASFHGRDLFAPVATMLAQGERLDCSLDYPPMNTCNWPDDLMQVVYVDHYGNAMTGLRADHVPADRRLCAGGVPLPVYRTFVEGAEQAPFWYRNSIGLAEIAVKSGDASRQLGLKVGTPVSFLP